MGGSIAVMNEGRVEEVGTREEVYLRPATRFVAGFLGAMNWINGVGLRPETTRLARETGSLNGYPARPATITRTIFLGNCIHVAARLETREEAVAQLSREEALPNSGAHPGGEPSPNWWRPRYE